MPKTIISALLGASMLSLTPMLSLMAQTVPDPTGVAIEAPDSIPREAAEAARHFYNLTFIEQITPELFRAVFQESVYANGYERLLKNFAMLNGHFRPVKTLTIHSLEDERYALRLINVDGGGAEVVLHIPQSAGYKIGDYSVRPWQPPIAADLQNLSDLEIADVVDQYLKDLAARDEFSGVVALSRNGVPFYKTSLGLANKAESRAMTLDTPVNLGSANKMWTSLAISQLVTAGKIDWRDRVGKFLPDYPNARVREDVTIHDLLSHRAGLSELFNERYMKIRKNVLSVEDIMLTFADQPLLTEPGAMQHYSNAGPIVLGRIIEVVSGMDYYDYIESNILQKIGMSNSGFFTLTETESGKAIGYHRGRGGNGHSAGQGHSTAQSPRQPNAKWLGSRGSPGGGAYSSANDMLKYADALRNNTLVSAETFSTLTTSRTGGDPNDGYGYLFSVNTVNGHKFVGHNGGAPGINADFSLFTELGYAVVVLANYGGAALPVSRHIRSLIAYGATANAHTAQ